MATDKLVNMAMSAEERTETQPSISEEKVQGPQYPWGLELRLDDDACQKLGIDESLTAGKTVVISAKATVTSVTVNSTATPGTAMTGDGKEEKEISVSLQITDMAVGSGLPYFADV